MNSFRSAAAVVLKGQADQAFFKALCALKKAPFGEGLKTDADGQWMMSSAQRRAQ
jgi:hypothetical protein